MQKLSRTLLGRCPTGAWKVVLYASARVPTSVRGLGRTAGADPLALHHGQDVADPGGKLCLVIDPAQHYAIQPHGTEVHEPLDNLLRGADQEITTPAGATQALAWARRPGLAAAARQVGDRVPVAFVEDIVAGIVESFLFRGTAHHRARGPDLELPSKLLAAKRTLGADAGSRLVVGVLGNAGEHHVRILRGEPGTSGRAAGVHDRREGF